MSLHVFNVDLIGPTFSIQTDESLDYMQSLIMRLRERLGSLRESTRVSDPLRLSILLNITLMDELQRARERSLEGGVALDSSEEEKEFASITARLIADLDRSLEITENAQDPGEGRAETVLVNDAPDRVK
jgi:cell division protein ZapA (FtsZ GTPase activity inhibitor)